MRRRDFIVGIAGSAAAWPLTARAQQPSSQSKVVAILESSTAMYGEAFRKRLEALGWQEGRNIKYEIREGESDANRARSFADELVALKPNVFVATNTQMAQFILNKTSDIPVVFILVPDPVGSGLVKSIARPGGNVTGFTNFEPSVAGKWLEFLRDVTPDLRRVALLLQTGNPTSAGYEKAVEAAAPAFSVAVYPTDASDGTTIDGAMDTFARDLGNGLIVAPSALAANYRDRIIAQAAQHRLPTMYPYSEFTDAGGLMSYGFNREVIYRQAAEYVDRILRGEKPADLPVLNPIKYDLAINLKTANAMGINIPRSMLLLADEVIE